MSEPWPTTTHADAMLAGHRAVDVEIAVLDLRGVIVAVNAAWDRFSLDNGGDPSRTGVGVNYLEVCDRAAGDPAVDTVAGALRAALSGELAASVSVEIPCHGPDEQRWFDVLISARLDASGAAIGATVSLSPARVRPPARLDGDPSASGEAREVDALLQRVALVARAFSGAMSLDEIVTIVVRQGMAGTSAEAAALALLDEDGVLQPVAVPDRLKPVVAAVGRITLERELPMPVAIRSNSPVWVPSRADGELRFPELAAADLASGAWAALPLEVDGVAVGALGVSFRTAHTFSPSDRLYLRALADLTALALPSGADHPSTPAPELHLAFAEAVFNGAPDGIVVCDADGRIVLANRQIEALFGYHRDQLAGQPVEILLPEGSRTFHHAFRRDYLTRPTARAMGSGRAFLARCGDGRTVAVDVGLAPITTGAAIYTVASVRLAPLATGPAEPPAARQPDDTPERVARRLVGVGLALAALSSRKDLDESDRVRLRDITDRLDRCADDLLATAETDDTAARAPQTDRRGPDALVASLREHVDAIEAIFELLADVDGLEQRLAGARSAAPWRTLAREQRARLSVIV